MLNKILPKSDFTNNVITLMLGTAISQAVPIAISPILTRIYSPKDFGVFALYLSITSIIAVIVTGRYELAITLPYKDSDAFNLVALSCCISLIIAIACLIVVILFNAQIVRLLGNPEISRWLYFIPITVFLAGIYQSFNFWQNRKKKYKNLSKSRVIQTVTTSSVNMGIGIFFRGVLGLTLGNIIGQALSTIYLVRSTFLYDGNLRQHIKPVKIVALAKRYKNFPKYDALASLFNISSNQSANIFFNVFFGAATSGYFYLTQKIFGLPVTLIAAAIQDVFKMEMTTLHNSGGNTRKLFNKTFVQLFLLGLIPTVITYFLAIKIFVFFFGAAWEPAGVFVQIMVPVLFLRFLSFPLSYMFYVVEKQHYNIIGQFLLLLLILGSFLIGKNHNAIFTVKLMTISYSLFYIGYLFLSYSFTSTGKDNKIVDNSIH